MSPNKLIKAEARGRLSGHWPSALGVLVLPASVLVLLTFVCEYILYCTSSVSTDAANQHVPNGASRWGVAAVLVLCAAAWIFLLHPLMLGVQRWWAAMAFGHDTGAVTCLYYFSREAYLPCVRYTLCLARQLLLRLVPTAVVVVLLSGVKLYLGHPETFSVLTHHGVSHLTAEQLNTCTELLIGGIGTGIPIFLLFSLSLFPAGYLYITDPSHEVFSRAARLVRSNLLRLLCFLLSFSWWYMLSMFVFPLIYTVPYLGIASAVFCKWIILNDSEKNAASDPK